MDFSSLLSSSLVIDERSCPLKKKHKKITNSHHHICPRSRCRNQKKENLILVNAKKHEAYHTLFNNALPEEAVLLLIKEWWYRDKDADKKLVALIDKLQNQTEHYLDIQRRLGLLAGAGV